MLQKCNESLGVAKYCLHDTSGDYTRNMHAQWASHQFHASPMRPAQLCACMSINDIPDRDGHVHTYIHHENRSLIQSLALMHLAITEITGNISLQEGCSLCTNCHHDCKHSVCYLITPQYIPRHSSMYYIFSSLCLSLHTLHMQY